MFEKLDYVTTLTPEILEKAEKELGEDEHLRTQSVLALRDWAKKQPHLHAMPLGKFTFLSETNCKILIRIMPSIRRDFSAEILTWLQI